MISPILFNFYMDDLFDIQKNTGSVCIIGDFYTGCAGYADDLLLLCPSRGGLQEMLDKAQEPCVISEQIWSSLTTTICLFPG